MESPNKITLGNNFSAIFSGTETVEGLVRLESNMPRSSQTSTRVTRLQLFRKEEIIPQVWTRVRVRVGLRGGLRTIQEKCNLFNTR